MFPISTDEARRILAQFPELRASDIPPEGMILQENIFVVCTQEGEVCLYRIHR